MPCDDDCFSYAEVKINGKDYPINFIDDILLENNVDDALDEFYRIQQTGEYWQPDGNKTLDDAIHECRSGKHHDYDIVEGPMADDTIWNYVNDFLSGDISREAFWALAKFKHPTHQISFHTEVALKCLSFKEAIEV